MTEQRPGIHHGGAALDPTLRNPGVQHAHEAPYEPAHESVEFDREIQYHQLIWMGVSLLLIAVVSGILVFFLLRGFVNWRAKGAEEAPVMPPPAAIGGPQLLARPERELDQVRSTEKQRLESYGWVDQASGVAHIHIDRAIEIVAERGLPTRPAAPAGTPAPSSVLGGAPTTATVGTTDAGTVSGVTHAAPGASIGGADAGTPGAEPDATPPEVRR